MAITNVYTGANGTLLFSPDTTHAPEGADANALLAQAMYNLTEVGRVKGVEIHVNTTLQGYYEIGARHPVSLHSENIYISGKIDRAHINGALLFLLLGRGANPTHINEPYVQPALLMNVVLQDPAFPSTRSVLNLGGVKFENWSFSLPEDDFVMENVTFKALTINVQDEEATTAGGTRSVKTPAFPA
ncbi:MAG TPA: hypothetical protein VG649_02460 [Candidatus Angelobacter sp.]|jgi:hypothetical protein|nr:hypothetical protein [Candidatus Angelobacter sp.]